jgi:uncharacterized protein involved in exopolysaccharide biosynthesis
METYNNNLHQPQSQEDNSMSLKDIWALCLGHWKWFVLSVAVCLAAAAVYTFKTIPVYTRSASVLIKQDR